MRKSYINHRPTTEGIKKIEELRYAADALHTVIESTGGPSRERSIALTKLEECLMWAVKGLVLNDPNSTPQEPAPK